MTTLHASKKDLTVSIGFFVLIAAAIAVSTLVRGSTVLGVVFLVIAAGLVVLAVALHRQPANELRISNDRMVLARNERVLGSHARHDTAGRVDVRRHIHRGRAYWYLVPEGGEPASGFPVDGFVPDDIRTAGESHGWTVGVVQ